MLGIHCTVCCRVPHDDDGDGVAIADMMLVMKVAVMVLIRSIIITTINHQQSLNHH